MKVRSISFTDEMAARVRAKLKWQTRRGLKHRVDANGVVQLPDGPLNVLDPELLERSPYGVPGDQLWVRETHYRFGHWEPKTTASKKTGRLGYRFVADSTETRFEAPEGARVSPPRTDDEREKPQWYKRLARFMPRTSSRTLLEVASTRVERLNAITEEDAKAEGVEVKATISGGIPYYWMNYETADDPGSCRSAVESFASLWRSINGADSWGPNWVWVVEFQVLP